MQTTNPPAIPEIDLTAATYAGLALEAARDGNTPRALECLASIDAASWTALHLRFPNLSDLIITEATR